MPQHREHPLPSGDNAKLTAQGFRLLEAGRFEDARFALERSIKIQPYQGIAYYGLAQSRRFTENDLPFLEKIQSHLGSGYVGLRESGFAHFALAKAFDDLKLYELAFAEYKAGNQILLKVHLPQPFDRSRYSAGVDWCIDTFTNAFFEENNSPGSASELPVQIVGMMRSGTSLLEQILSSHPEIAGAGELPFWLVNGRSAMVSNGTRLAVGNLPLVAKAYEELLDAVSPGSVRVTDKMPHNMMFLGVFHSVFPNALMIHCRRSPMDTCLSIFMTGFLAPPEFAHDLENIVFVYEEYQRLMKHWRSVLPTNKFIEVDYEQLVQDREPTLRRIIAALGLEWNDQCLHHEANRRAVQTPSLWQVRQPIYSSSVARWKNYEPWLGELPSKLFA